MARTAVSRRVVEERRSEEEYSESSALTNEFLRPPPGSEVSNIGPAVDPALLYSMAHDPSGMAVRSFNRTLSPDRLQHAVLQNIDIYRQPQAEHGRAATGNSKPMSEARSPARDTETSVQLDDHDQELLDALRVGSLESRRHAAEMVRLQCRDDIPFRAKFAQAGMEALVELLWCTDEKTVEHMVTALHNVALNEELQEGVLRENVITALTHVLETGNTTAKANTAATLFNFARKLNNTEKLVEYPRLYRPLVRLLDGEDLRGRKDAAYAICYLTLVTKGRREFVSAGIVQVLVDILDDSVEGLEDKAVAIIGNLAKSSEGRAALVAGDAIKHLAEVLESGSTARAKEDAASALLLLANHDDDALTLIAEEGMLLALQVVARSEHISARGQSKARSLLELLRRQQLEGQMQSFNTGSSGESFQ